MTQYKILSNKAVSPSDRQPTLGSIKNGMKSDRLEVFPSKDDRSFRSANGKYLFYELKEVLFKYCKGVHKNWLKKQDRAEVVKFILGKLNSKELGTMYEVKNKVRGQNKFHLLDLFCCYVLTKKNDSEKEVVEIFQLVFNACDFDAQLIDFRYIKAFYIKHLSTMKAMGIEFKNELSIRDITTLEKYKDVIQANIERSKSRTIKQFRPLEQQYEQMCKNQNNLFVNCPDFLFSFLKNFNNDYIAKLDSDCTRILENIERELRKGRRVRRGRNRKEIFNGRLRKLLLRAIKRYRICALEGVYSGFEFESKMGRLCDGVFTLTSGMIRGFKRPNFAENFGPIMQAMTMACLVIYKTVFLRDEIQGDIKKYHPRWMYFINTMLSTYHNTNGKLQAAISKTPKGKKAKKVYQRDGGAWEMSELSKNLRFGSGEPDSEQKISTNFMNEFGDVVKDVFRGKVDSTKRVVKKYLGKFSKLFAKREKKYKDYVSGKKKISDGFKKRQRMARAQRKVKREDLAEKERAKRKEIQRICQLKINKIEKARDQFNAEYKALSQLMSDYRAKVKNLDRGVFSFDKDAYHYYDVYDEFLAQSITSCLQKYRSNLQGFDCKNERELLAGLRVFRDNMLNWKAREDKLKKLYGNPFSSKKQQTNETFRGKLLAIVKKNEFAKALFNWTCRLRQSGKAYVYKGFTWGATYFEATTGNYLSQSTHYLKCRDIIYSIKEYLRHEGDHVSAIVRLVLLKELKMCEIARECFYKKWPDDADAMDYWWEGNPYPIDFKSK